jgi:NAD(P)-dependent dehydrogenase (short-subunit alcohol dehydrogenase family)
VNAVAGVADAVEPGALRDRVVLVVGAHGGLGDAASRACARAGAKLVLLGRRVPKLDRLHDAVAGEGGECALYPLDLEGASPDDYAQMVARIDEAFGRLDGVLHCAAEFRGLTPLALTDPADFARAVHVNLTARWWLTQACLPLLGKASDAAVVFALDAQAPGSRAYWGGYGLAQAAQVALVDMLQAELGPNSPVRVSGLDPGPMRTSLRANAFIAEHDRAAADPARAAARCVELLSPAGAAHRGQVWSPT